MEDLRLSPASLCPERGCASLENAQLSTLRPEPRVSHVPTFSLPSCPQGKAMFCSPGMSALRSCLFLLLPPSQSLRCKEGAREHQARGTETPSRSWGAPFARGPVRHGWGLRRPTWPQGRRGTGASLPGQKLPMQDTQHSVNFWDMLLSLVLPGASRPRPPPAVISMTHKPNILALNFTHQNKDEKNFVDTVVLLGVFP